jgi:hypothetical protein
MGSINNLKKESTYYERYASLVQAGRLLKCLGSSFCGAIFPKSLPLWG